MNSALVATPDELISRPRPASGRHYELSDGELVIAENTGAAHE